MGNSWPISSQVRICPHVPVLTSTWVRARLSLERIAIPPLPPPGTCRAGTASSCQPCRRHIWLAAGSWELLRPDSWIKIKSTLENYGSRILENHGQWTMFSEEEHAWTLQWSSFLRFVGLILMMFNYDQYGVSSRARMQTGFVFFWSAFLL